MERISRMKLRINKDILQMVEEKRYL